MNESFLDIPILKLYVLQIISIFAIFSDLDIILTILVTFCVLVYTILKIIDRVRTNEHNEKIRKIQIRKNTKK